MLEETVRPGPRGSGGSLSVTADAGIRGQHGTYDPERIGPAIVARLSSGVPTDRKTIDLLDGRWRALADEMERAQPEMRATVRKRHLGGWADGAAALAAILKAAPGADPLAEPVQ